MTARTRKTPAKPKPAAEPVDTKPVVEEPAPGEDPNPTLAERTDPAPRRPDSRVEAVAVDECMVDGCPCLEFEPGRRLCNGHYTTRLDLREVASHG